MNLAIIETVAPDVTIHHHTPLTLAGVSREFNLRLLRQSEAGNGRRVPPARRRCGRGADADRSAQRRVDDLSAGAGGDGTSEAIVCRT